MTAFGEPCCRVNNSIHTLPDSLVDRGMRQGDINTPSLFCLIPPKKRSCVFLIQSVFNHQRITEVSPVTCLQTELKYQFQLLFKNSWIPETVFASLPQFPHYSVALGFERSRAKNIGPVFVRFHLSQRSSSAHSLSVPLKCRDPNIFKLCESFAVFSNVL